jgi:hypothetical protein
MELFECSWKSNPGEGGFFPRSRAVSHGYQNAGKEQLSFQLTARKGTMKMTFPTQNVLLGGVAEIGLSDFAPRCSILTWSIG